MKKRRDRTGIFPSAPPDMLVYAVGDVHGQSHLMDALLHRIERDAGAAPEELSRVLVFVGDYVDRGPDSAGVISRLISSMPEEFEVRCLLGNHEEILLNYLDAPDHLDHWLMNGGGETLRSYGVEAPGMGAPWDEQAACRDAFLTAMPPAHRSFLKGLDLMTRAGDYVFVHAGIRPGVALEDQSRDDLLWIRAPFLDSDDDLGCVVVHGHTPGPVPVERANRIGIDTGAIAFGQLTAVRLCGSDRRFLTAVA